MYKFYEDKICPNWIWRLKGPNLDLDNSEYITPSSYPDWLPGDLNKNWLEKELSIKELTRIFFLWKLDNV